MTNTIDSHNEVLEKIDASINIDTIKSKLLQILDKDYIPSDTELQAILDQENMTSSLAIIAILDKGWISLLDL